VANAGGYTPIAAAAIGCEILYCDVDEKNFVMDPRSLEKLLSKEVKAVVVTHLYGNVAPVNEIKKMCEPFGIRIIEDCAQSFGAYENIMATGTIGHVGTFSFYPTKNLGAIGDGGALATNDPEIAERILALRQYGWTSKYKIDLPGGMNSRLDEIQAAVLRVGLSKLDLMNQKRREIVKRYSNAIENSRMSLITSFSPESAAHLAVLLLPEEISREDFRNYLTGLGIGTDVHYPILDSEQIALNSEITTQDIPISRSVIKKIVSIPLFPELTEVEVSHISQSLSDFSQRF
jgi:dTDP-4-amino-4,6-dideoxygalactose transaminase